MHARTSSPLPLPHDHDFLGAAHDRNARRTAWVVALTAAMMLVEVAAGLLTGSMALLADGIHMASHAGTLGVSLIAYRVARRHVDNPRFTFGTGKVGDLAGFASALLLGAVAFGIAIESLLRLMSPAPVAYAEALWVAAIGLVVNLASAGLLGSGSHDPAHAHGHSHDRDAAPGHSSHGHDHNLRSAYLHVLADALTSVLAIVALLAGLYLGWWWLDGAIGILGAIVIARWAWGLLWDTAAVLTDAVDTCGLEQRLRAAIEDPDTRVLDLHVWQVGPAKYAATVALAARDPLDPADYARRICASCDIAHLTIEARRN